MSAIEMSRKRLPIEFPHRYAEALLWILHHRAGGKRPPETVDQVSGWVMTRFTAYLFQRHPANVARDLIDMHDQLEHGAIEPAALEQWP